MLAAPAGHSPHGAPGGFVWGVCAVGCTLHSTRGEAEEWLPVEIRLEGKKAKLSSLFLPEYILLFHPAFTGSGEQGPAFLPSKARSLFLFEGQKGCVEIT